MLFVHAAQLNPLRPANLAKAAHRTGNTVRLGAEGTDKPRALLARFAFHQNRPTRFAEAVQHRLRRNHSLGPSLCNRLDQGLPWGGLSGSRGYRRLSRIGSGPNRNTSGSRCSHESLLRSPPRRVHCPATQQTHPEIRQGLRRSAMTRSVRRLCRVFAPSVGKPHGVLG